VKQAMGLKAAPLPTYKLPRPGDRVWSNFFKERLILVDYQTDRDWKFMRESELTQCRIREGTVPFSSMPGDVE
jgi:hypothetical protein